MKFKISRIELFIIIFSFMFGIFTLWLGYNSPQVNPFICLVIGVLFCILSVIFLVTEFLYGIAYEEKRNIPLDELDQYKELINGLFVEYKNCGKIIPLIYKEKVINKGYVTIIIQYNRDKKIRNWFIRSIYI